MVLGNERSGQLVLGFEVVISFGTEAVELPQGFEVGLMEGVLKRTKKFRLRHGV